MLEDSSRKYENINIKMSVLIATSKDVTSQSLGSKLAFFVKNVLWVNSSIFVLASVEFGNNSFAHVYRVKNKTISYTI